MKKIAFILLLFSCSLSWSQQFIVVDSPKREQEKKEQQKKEQLEKEQENKEKERKSAASIAKCNELLNYSPKGFVPDLKSKPNNRVLMGDLNSIGSLELRYAYQEQLKLNAAEVKWLEEEINALAVAFFTEGKPVIIKKIGGYGGCPGQYLETEERKGTTVTILNFCYTCSGASVYEDRFIAIFNNRIEKLMASKK